MTKKERAIYKAKKEKDSRQVTKDFLERLKEQLNEYKVNKADAILFKEFINATKDNDISGVVNIDILKKEYINALCYSGDNELDKMRFFNIVKLLSDMAMQYGGYECAMKYIFNTGFDIDHSGSIYDAFMYIFLKYDGAADYIIDIKEKSTDEYHKMINKRSIGWFKRYSKNNLNWYGTFGESAELYDISEKINNNGYYKEDRDIIKEKFYNNIEKKKMAYTGEWKPLRLSIETFDKLWSEYISIIELYDFDDIGDIGDVEKMSVEELFVVFYILEILEDTTYLTDLKLLLVKEWECDVCDSSAMIFYVFLKWLQDNKDNKAVIRKGKMQYI